MLFSSAWVYAEDEKVHWFFKEKLHNQIRRQIQKKIARLAEDNSICIVFENKLNLKKLFIRTRIKCISTQGREWTGKHRLQQNSHCLIQPIVPPSVRSSKKFNGQYNLDMTTTLFQKMFTCALLLNFNINSSLGGKLTHAKKELLIASTHIIMTQTSTSVWNNSRDQMVEFDWQTYVSAVTEQLKHSPSTNQRQPKLFLLQPVPNTRNKFVFWSKSVTNAALTREKNWGKIWW